MKKFLFLLMTLVLLSNIAYASGTFDVSIFQSNDIYEVEFDDMDDTAEISFASGGLIVGKADEEGSLFGWLDIKMVEDLPPVIRLQMLYMGEEWIFTDKVIIKPADTRYTFEVDRDTSVEDGKIYEMFTIVLTDESIGLLKDIIDSNASLVKYRLAGDRDVDGSFFVSVDEVTHLYNDYIAAGGLESDFSTLRVAYPCEIK